jgi:hypothetical protein
MGWDRSYYYRVRKEGGRVVREYVGGGALGALAAEVDARDRARRRGRAEALRKEKARLAADDAEVQAVCEAADLAARAALLAAGFHQHKRGEWRRRRRAQGDPNAGRRAGQGR